MFSLSGLFEGFRKGSARRSTVQSLRSLSAAQLRDIGVAPDQIGDVVEAMMQSADERPAASRRASAKADLAPQSRAAMAGCG